MKHCLMELYWRFHKAGERDEELLEIKAQLGKGLDREQAKLLLKMADLNDERLEQETFAAFERGFKLASALAFELAQPPHLFCTEEHLALEDVEKPK